MVQGFGCYLFLKEFIRIVRSDPAGPIRLERSGWTDQGRELCDAEWILDLRLLKSPTSRKGREKWGTHWIVDACEIKKPPPDRRLLTAAP